MANRDIDIRPALLRYLVSQHSEQEHLECIEELGICSGESRIDIAIVDDSIHGYEIKSKLDTLSRLESQVNYYSRALKFVTAVVSENHLPEVINSVPEWWGIITAHEDATQITFDQARIPKCNPSMDPLAVAQFLWREEALEVLVNYGLDKGIRTKPRKILWERLSNNLELQELTELVSLKLKERAAWRLKKLAC